MTDPEIIVEPPTADLGVIDVPVADLGVIEVPVVELILDGC